MSKDNTRDFLDRALRDRLQRPENMAELMADTIPDLAARLVFSEMKPVMNEFLVGNFREREADLLYEIPYLSGDRKTTTFVCVLVEHQSRTEWRIPMKTYIYAALYWESQWREYDKQPAPKPPFRLTPVVPLVFYTHRKEWASFRRFRDLFDIPEGLEPFVPHWEPLFWQLAQRTVDELLGQPSVFLKSLALLKAEDENLLEAQQLFQAVFEQIDPLHTEQYNRWSEALRFMLSWAQNRRPEEERSQWHDFTLQLQHDANRQREIEAMERTIAQSYIEEGRQIGQQEGRQIGQQEGLLQGELRRARGTLLRLGSRRLSAADELTIQAINGITDLHRLDRMTDQLDSVTSWAALLAIL